MNMESFSVETNVSGIKDKLTDLKKIYTRLNLAGPKCIGAGATHIGPTGARQIWASAWFGGALGSWAWRGAGPRATEGSSWAWARSTHAGDARSFSSLER